MADRVESTPSAKDRATRFGDILNTNGSWQEVSAQSTMHRTKVGLPTISRVNIASNGTQTKPNASYPNYSAFKDNNLYENLQPIGSPSGTPSGPTLAQSPNHTSPQKVDAGNLIGTFEDEPPSKPILSSQYHASASTISKQPQWLAPPSEPSTLNSSVFPLTSSSSQPGPTSSIKETTDQLPHNNAVQDLLGLQLSFTPAGDLAPLSTKTPAKTPIVSTVTTDEIADHSGSISAEVSMPNSGQDPTSSITPRLNELNLCGDEEVNQDLQERFVRKPWAATGISQSNTHPSSDNQIPVDTSIRDYLRAEFRSKDASSWISRREIPSSEEINPPEEIESGEMSSGESREIIMLPNKIDGPWDSTRLYLESHYALLREDAVAPLRESVLEVFIIGITLAPAGIAARITFSLRRAGKKINWEQSKRLVTGTMVALTPANDMFQRVCRVAIIAARPLAGLKQNPPQVDIFFASPDEIEIDPQQEWMMVEARTGYYEASRHTLLSLQKMSTESFPLSEHIVQVKKRVPAPRYVRQQPFTDLSSVFISEPDDFLNVNVVNDWPQRGDSELDSSQLAALKRILAKQLAIVQGPPGTGKTHVSVVAIKTLLCNMREDDPPLVLAAHTNHALDQLLRHVAEFEPDFIRLGGRTADVEVVKPRTLFEIRRATPPINLKGGLRGSAMANLKNLRKSIPILLAPLIDTNGPVPVALFRDFGLITQAQFDSLETGAKEWVRFGVPNGTSGVLITWLGHDNLVRSNLRTLPEDFGTEVEEVDLEFEQLKELEAESKTSDEDDVETLKGPWIPLSEPLTGRKPMGLTEQKSDNRAKRALAKENMWSIPEIDRVCVYSFLVRKLKESLIQSFRAEAHKYAATALDVKIGRWEIDSIYLRKARVIGMTTTGLSKFRGLVASLNPRLVLIEEAGETLEAFATAACFETLEHLILVGDHQQLRGHCAVKELEGNPWNLDVSMFERLVGNGIEFSQLTKQRRMIPEIREIISTIYENLEDHPSVLERPPIPGMGGINSFFFSHDWPETTDSSMSKCNSKEAEMIIGFFDYLVQNGIRVKDITVLAFYNGQRKAILKGLRDHPNMQGQRFNVFTVDSYQGEENSIVLLSLVRSRDIGFLEVDNRVCVALSRAQRGFYMFGQALLLEKATDLWGKVIDVMKSQHRLGKRLPLRCSNHGWVTPITEPLDWAHVTGGCRQKCSGLLPCGHICRLKCHPSPHDFVVCQHACERSLPCGHKCSELCYVQPCQCLACVKGKGQASYTEVIARRSDSASPPKPPRRSKRSSERRELTAATQAFRDFANGGHVEADARLAAMALEDEAKLIEKLRSKAIEEMGDLISFEDEILTSSLPNRKPSASSDEEDFGRGRNIYTGLRTGRPIEATVAKERFKSPTKAATKVPYTGRLDRVEPVKRMRWVDTWKAPLSDYLPASPETVASLLDD